MIEVRQARYFLAVADTLHFGRAAEQLGMSQPPLSQAILQLERQVQARLLERNNRRVALTEVGRLFAVECRRLLLDAERAQAVAKQASVGQLGTLRIGAVGSAFAPELSAALTAFERLYPAVDLQVVEVDSPNGAAALQDREIDVAIIRQTVSLRGLRATPWRTDHLVVAMHGGHRLAGHARSSVELATFADQPWIWVRRDISPDYHDRLLAACQQAGFVPEPRHVANSITTQLAMAACGLGVALVPDVAARTAQGVAYRELSTRVELVELSLVTRTGRPDPLVRQFIQAAQLADTPA